MAEVGSGGKLLCAKIDGGSYLGITLYKGNLLVDNRAFNLMNTDERFDVRYNLCKGVALDGDIDPELADTVVGKVEGIFLSGQVVSQQGGGVDFAW